MFNLTYDLWREIVEDIVISHQPLFEAMYLAADDLDLTAALIEELKKKEELDLPGDCNFKLQIDFIQDEIEGFIIFLAAEEPQELFEQAKSAGAEERGFSLEEMQAFEMEHGLNMQEEILVAMEETYGVQAEFGDDRLIYYLVIFDSQDIDDSLTSELVWQEDVEN
ncbi:MAG: hypothetical protein ACP5OU_04980 [Methanothrix sp.]